ncbi:hypothetical protein EJ04DRAFT_507321 [Polyplosphaeria fusca]|uniref:SnoaL-like domain-containing protein n=1 Tax=Polyplosphaeria fusca TaxID=682080 RepID=A0A9P4RDA8_9PLEO|nr:hypothetical protein EJ04DRAFT_507321 [Polyplosphaeria fusca]
MTTKETAIKLTRDNLMHIFGESDEAKRLKTIETLWFPSGECMFIDAMGVFKTHQAISGMVSQLEEMNPGQVFTELSSYDVLQQDKETDTWVTRVKWGVGPPGKKPGLTGWDVVTIVGGKIKACYTFLGDPIQK